MTNYTHDGMSGGMNHGMWTWTLVSAALLALLVVAILKLAKK